MALKIECVVECENYLGESPIWDVESGMLYWVDGTGQRKGKNNIFKLNPRTGEFVSRLIPDHDIGALALRKNGGLILAVDDGFYFYDFDRGDLELIQLIEEDLRMKRDFENEVLSTMRKDSANIFEQNLILDPFLCQETNLAIHLHLLQLEHLMKTLYRKVFCSLKQLHLYSHLIYWLFH